ncbi:MAG: helix-turn-helix domain-containing protein [Lysobacter sp.]|nr:helix-turn-helix domain-containing protein [Lysobacter sp.]
MRNRTREVWFVVFPGSELLDLSGPWSVLGYANEVLGWPAYAAKIVAPTRGAVPTRHGVVLGGASSLEEAARNGFPNTVVIAGATPANGRSAGEMRVARWLREHARRVSRIVSICTGAFVLGEAGLLDRRSATTHWVYRDELRARFARARVDSDNLFLRDGRIWTSAGITAGLDLMLAIIEEDHGHRAALTVAKSLVLYLRRSDQQAMFFDESIVPVRELDSSVHILTALIQGHLAKPLPIAKLAKLAGMSTRTLARVCERDFGQTPSSVIRRMRLEQAQRMLEHTSLPLKTIATRTGVGDEGTLWRLFRRQLGIAPMEYRRRFKPSRAA